MSVSIVFFGTPEFSAPALKALLDDSRYFVRAVVTQPDKPAGRGKKLSMSPIKELALKIGIPVLQPHSIRKSGQEFIEELELYGPFDVGIVIAFGQILPTSVLYLPEKGCINIHASILPRWRGAAPIHRAIMSGDPESGVCLMQMEAGLDTGPVFVTERIPVERNETFGSLHDKLSSLGAKTLAENLINILEGRIHAEPQSDAGVTYAQKVLSDEALIVWKGDCVQLSNLIRGLSPVPGAFTMLNGLRLKILFATSVQSEHSTSPGSIVQVDADSFSVKCGNGILRVSEVQLEGKKRMTVSDFLRGFPLKAGTILG